MVNLDFIGFKHYAACSSGRIYSIRSGKYLAGVIQKTGYVHVSLCHEGTKKNFSVHRLIALAYLGRGDDVEGLVVNHKNGDKEDNRLSNLEWCTYQENAQHAVMTGLRVSPRNPDRSLDDETVHKVCQLLEDNWRNKDIAKLLNIKHTIVGSIRFGKDYADISCEYNTRGTLPSRRKICTEKLIKICEMLEKGHSYKDIADEVGCSTATISKVKHRKTGVYISKNYNF